MLINYLKVRKEILEKELKTKQDKLDHNMISIVDANNKIEEIDSTVDEASEIFSVKVREDSGFKNQEINELEVNITAYITENEQLESEIAKLKDELFIVENCIEKYSNVSRETLDENDIEYTAKEETKKVSTDNNDKIYKSSLIEKLKFCKSLLSVDDSRVNIELDNIISMLSK